jgi:formyl-CoA transferase
VVAKRADLEADRRVESNVQRTANRTLLMPVLEELFKARAVGDWLDALRRTGVPAAPSNSVEQVLSDPRVRQRRMVVDLPHPTLGTPFKVNGALGLEVQPAPSLGKHTTAVLSELAGYSPDRLSALRAEGAIA